jgi:DNA-binding MarR family transcriptional regulator
MELDKIRTLNILEELSVRDFTSQRELSKKLNISVGLANLFIKRLAKKGYFKVHTLPKNRLKYILTPKGVAEKSNLTWEFFQYALKFYKITRDKISCVLEDLITQNIKKIVIYGAGDLAEILYIILQQTQLDLAAVVDPKRYGKKFMGKDLMDIKNLSYLDYDKIIITELAQGETIENIADDLEIPHDKFALIQ